MLTVKELAKIIKESNCVRDIRDKLQQITPLKIKVINGNITLKY